MTNSMTPKHKRPRTPAHRVAVGSEQGQLTIVSPFDVGQRVILQSTGEEGEIVSASDDLGYRVRIQFRGRLIVLYAGGYRLKAL